MMHFITNLLAVFTTLLFVSNVDGQSAVISIPVSLTLNQDELRIICSPGAGFNSINVIALKKNVSNAMVSLVTLSPTGNIWGTSYSIQDRATATGTLSGSSPNLEVLFSTQNVRCGDAGSYSCSISGFDSSNNLVSVNSDERSLSIQDKPTSMNPMRVTVNNAITSDRIFAVGTSLQLSCSGEIGSFPDNPNPSIRFCLKRPADSLFTGVTGLPTLSEVSRLNDCMYQRTSTWVYNLTSLDQNIRFMCESGHGAFCESGTAKSYVNVTIEQEDPGTQSQDTQSSNAGVIVGAVVGSLAFLFLLILLVYFLVVRRRAGGETYRTKEDVPGYNGAPEGPVYSIPNKERNSGTGREYERDRERERRPKDRHAHENKGMDEPQTEKRDHNPYENSMNHGRVNPALSHDTDDGDVTPTRGMHDVPMGSAV